MNITKECGDYPLGALEDSRAPFNQIGDDEILVEVTVSQTLSTSTSVLITKNYTDKDLKDAVIAQITLPIHSINVISKSTWVEDDFEVIKE